jgi:hypothetical protein
MLRLIRWQQQHGVHDAAVGGAGRWLAGWALAGLDVWQNMNATIG